MSPPPTQRKVECTENIPLPFFPLKQKKKLIKLFFHEGDGIHHQLIGSVPLQYQRHDKFTMLLSCRPNNNNNNNNNIKT